MTPIDLKALREQNDMVRRGREAMRRDIADLCDVIEAQAAALGSVSDCHDPGRCASCRDSVAAALSLVTNLVKRET